MCHWHLTWVDEHYAFNLFHLHQQTRIKGHWVCIYPTIIITLSCLHWSFYANPKRYKKSKLIL